VLQLQDMGFAASAARRALALNRNIVEAAVEWLLSNGPMNEDDDEDDEEEEEVEEEELEEEGDEDREGDEEGPDHEGGHEGHGRAGEDGEGEGEQGKRGRRGSRLWTRAPTGGASERYATGETVLGQPTGAGEGVRAEGARGGALHAGAGEGGRGGGAGEGDMDAIPSFLLPGSGAGGRPLVASRADAVAALEAVLRAGEDEGLAEEEEVESLMLEQLQAELEAAAGGARGRPGWRRWCGRGGWCKGPLSSAAALVAAAAAAGLPPGVQREGGRPRRIWRSCCGKCRGCFSRRVGCSSASWRSSGLPGAHHHRLLLHCLFSPSVDLGIYQG